MDNPIPDLVGDKLWQKLSSIYREWVKRDDYGSAPNFGRLSMRRVLQWTAASKFATFRLDAKLSDVVKMSESIDMGVYRARSGHAIPGDIAYAMLCAAPLPSLLHESSCHGAFGNGPATFADLIADSKASSWSEIVSRFEGHESVERMAKALATVFWDVTGSDRLVRSYFVRQPDERGFFDWWHGAGFYRGRPLADHQFRLADGIAVVSVGSHQEEVEDNPVRPYEWHCHLRANHASDLPDAVACGMVYKVPRNKEGMPACSMSDLRWASDAISDTDVAQMLAFLNSVEAPAMIHSGDLCFLWLWERREGAPKGLGKECLRVAISDLKKRFPRLRNIIVPESLPQFVDWSDPNDPEPIQIEKKTAISKLTHYIEEVGPQYLVGGDLLVLPYRVLDPDATLVALSIEDLQDTA